MNTYTWVVNLSLVLAIVLYMSVFFVLKKEIPHPIVLKISKTEIRLDQKKQDPNLEYIFKSPLFGFFENITKTQKKELELPVYIPKNFVSFPNMPSEPSELTEDDIPIPEIPILPPLQVTLKGLIISSNPLHNRAFIENIRTREEKLYKISDIIDDSQIVSINRTNIIFIRSNGQQETIEISNSFLNEKKEDSLQLKNIIIKLSNNSFEINTALFGKKYPTIGHFLDDLDIITYLENNIPIGCIIGFINEGNIAYELGFRTDDIILSVNGIPVGSAENRISIYESILLDKNLNTIVVTVKRKENILTFNYSLNRIPLENDLSMEEKGILESHAERIYYHSPEYKKNRIASTSQSNFTQEQLKTQSKIDNLNQQISKTGGKEYAIYR
jgi:type II secretory pathway component PulC